METTCDIAELEVIARECRRTILKMLNKAGSGHTGGSLSAIDIIVNLYYCQMKHDPQNPGWAERDRFILSKGHAAPALYTTLSQCGYFPEEDLYALRTKGSHLQGHPDMLKTPGVDFSTGSLGQGLSVACGMAIGLKLDRSESRVYAILGDGEIQEGMIWEAAMNAAHNKLDNLCAVVDYNGLQIDGYIKDVKNPEPIAEKWEAFNWKTISIDGHDFIQINEAFKQAAETKDRPTMIVAHTVKGKGVSIFEDQGKYHGVTPSDEELEQALKELA